MIAIQKKILELIKEIAFKHNLPDYVVEEIFKSEFRLLRDEIRSLNFKTVKLPSWGKYIPSQGKMEKFKDHYDEKREEMKNKKLENDRSFESNKDNALERTK